VSLSAKTSSAAALLLVLLAACHPRAGAELAPVGGEAGAGDEPAPVIVEREPSSTMLQAVQLREGPILGYVALRADAPLYGWNDQSVSYGVVSPFDEGEKGELPPRYSWRVLEDRGDFIAVESLGEEERQQQCLRQDEMLFRDYELRALVARESLVPVTRQESTIRFADGSGIRVGAGLPIELSAGESWLVAEGLELALPFEREALGASWTAPGLSEQPSLSAIAADPAPTQLLLDGKAISLEALEHPLGLTRSWRSLEADPAKALWTLSSSCVALELIGPPPRSSEEIEADEYGWGFGSGGSGSYWHIPAGTPATWPDGSDAGQALVDTRGSTMDDYELDERVCFKVHSSIELCFRRDQVVRH